MTPSNPTTLIVVDDHVMFREGLMRTFESLDGFQVLGACSSVSQGIALLDQRPDLVLLDADLGTERALDFIERAKRIPYTGKVLIVTAGISGEEAVHLVQAGVAGIIHKHHSSEALRSTILKVLAGESSLEQEYLNALFVSMNRGRPQPQNLLTERDRAILRGMFRGLTNREIGAQIDLSEAAVKATLRQLFEKLGVRTRAQLVRVALEQFKDQLV